jgi:hypothetical protein
MFLIRTCTLQLVGGKTIYNIYIYIISLGVTYISTYHQERIQNMPIEIDYKKILRDIREPDRNA